MAEPGEWLLERDQSLRGPFPQATHHVEGRFAILDTNHGGRACALLRRGHRKQQPSGSNRSWLLKLGGNALISSAASGRASLPLWQHRQFVLHCFAVGAAEGPTLQPYVQKVLQAFQPQWVPVPAPAAFDLPWYKPLRVQAPLRQHASCYTWPALQPVTLANQAQAVYFPTTAPNYVQCIAGPWPVGSDIAVLPAGTWPTGTVLAPVVEGNRLLVAVDASAESVKEMTRRGAMTLADLALLLGSLPIPMAWLRNFPAHAACSIARSMIQVDG